MKESLRKLSFLIIAVLGVIGYWAMYLKPSPIEPEPKPEPEQRWKEIWIEPGGPDDLQPLTEEEFKQLLDQLKNEKKQQTNL